MRREDDVEQLVEAVNTRFGPVEIAAFNATGPQPLLGIEEQTWQAYLDQLEFFVKSPLLLLKQLLPAMKERGRGRIVQIGSEVVELGIPRFASYVAAKGAQLGARIGDPRYNCEPGRAGMDTDRAIKRRLPTRYGQLFRTRPLGAYGPAGRCG